MYKIEDLIKNDCQAEINGEWVPARPLNYKFRSFTQKLKEAWMVFRGTADAFVWPKGQ